jgi:NO-binding membrane sensor protein with MHYT domain
MELRDRTGNYFFLLLAIAAWAVVFAVVTTTYPRENPTSGLVGAGAIGLACGVTAVPFFWLAAFARHRRIAFRGDWSRAIRRGAWVAMVVAILVALRIQGVLSLPIAIFVAALVVLAEMILSAER